MKFKVSHADWDYDNVKLTNGKTYDLTRTDGSLTFTDDLGEVHAYYGIVASGTYEGYLTGYSLDATAELVVEKEVIIDPRFKWHEGDSVQDIYHNGWIVLGVTKLSEDEILYHVKNDIGDTEFIIEQNLRDIFDDFPSAKESVKLEPSSDAVFHPSHYTIGGIESIEVLRAKLTKEQFEGFCLGNALKYSMRANFKGKFTEDMAKASNYISMLEEK